MLILSAPPDRHSLLEDALAFLTGTALVAISVQLLQSAGLFTGQIAGASLLAAYLGGWSFGVVFFVANLPFYVFAILRMGWRFALKSFIAVMLMSAISDYLSAHMVISLPHPALAALLAAATAGTGLLALFRHGASLGGVGMLALYLQERADIRAGVTQLVFDALVFLVALFVMPADVVLWSLLGAATLNLIIAMNHRRDRYIATS